MMRERGRGALLALAAWNRATARKVRNACQRCLERVGGPGSGHEFIVGDVVADRQQRHAAGREPRREGGAKANAAISQHALQLGVLGAGGLAVGGEEKCVRALGQPVGKLVDLGKRAVDSTDALHELISGADRKSIGGRVVTAAIAGDHNWGSLERGARLRFAMQAGELLDGLVKKLAEHARLPESAAG